MSKASEVRRFAKENGVRVEDAALKLTSSKKELVDVLVEIATLEQQERCERIKQIIDGDALDR